MPQIPKLVEIITTYDEGVVVRSWLPPGVPFYLEYEAPPKPPKRITLLSPGLPFLTWFVPTPKARKFSVGLLPKLEIDRAEIR